MPPPPPNWPKPPKPLMKAPGNSPSCTQQITSSNPFYFSMCKVLENRSQQDEERMDQLTNQLKEARLLAEDADNKSDEVSRKLAFVEDELEVAEDRVKGTLYAST